MRRRPQVLMARLRDDEAGMALVFVVLAMLVVTLFATAGLAYAANSQVLSRHDQDWNAALAAAQAGVDDYIAHLNRNDNYARTTFSDCSNLAMKGPAAPPNSCSWSSSTPAGWTYLSASGTPKRAAFHYDIDASQLDYSGTIDVKSTGEVNGVRRTQEVAVGRGGSTDFLYYTDHEDADPDNQSAYPSTMSNTCYPYWYGISPDSPSNTKSPRSNNGTNCQEITFVTGDVLDGRIHTNDTPLTSGSPEFKQGLETADPACKQAVPTNASTFKYCNRSRSGTVNYDSSYPRYADPLYPPDNSAGFAGFPGCDYTGATRIIFNSDGTMSVWSLNSRGLSASCGGDRPNGARIPVPTDQTIYVQNGGSVHQCAPGEIDGTLPLSSYGNGSGITNYYQYTDESMDLPDQYCGQGNVYVQGILKGRVTVAAQNSVVVTGDINLAGDLSGTDMLGLVATNSVEVFHPVYERHTCSAYSTTGPPKSPVYTCYVWNTSAVQNVSEASGWPQSNPASTTAGIEIDASIQTLQHSFYVQQYGAGTFQGKLTVLGSIAQRWRGIVGQSGSSGTGYLKNYAYDARLKFSSPPYFPQWQNSVWSGRQSGEISAPGVSSRYPDPS